MRISSLVFIFLFLAPAWAQAQSTAPELAGAYARCPKKDPANCPAVVAAFKADFPLSQPGPFLLLRSDGGGYLAPDERDTVNFTWQFKAPDTLVLAVKDSQKTKIEYTINGPLLTEARSGELYHLSLTDRELNPEARPFKETWERNKRAGKVK